MCDIPLNLESMSEDKIFESFRISQTEEGYESQTDEKADKIVSAAGSSTKNSDEILTKDGFHVNLWTPYEAIQLGGCIPNDVCGVCLGAEGEDDNELVFCEQCGIFPFLVSFFCL